MVEEFELTTGPKSARLAAGEYEIEFVGDAAGLQIQNGKFVLKRGDTVVAKVTERPKRQTVVEKPKSEQVEPAIEPKPRKPIEIIDLAAKGMDTFEESNPDLIGARKVREALQKKISIDFADQPLTDCVAFLKEQSGLEVFIDAVAFNEEGIEVDAPCTLTLKDVRIATAMKFLLEPLRCAWTIDRGQVRITTLAKEREEMVTRWYPVGRLLPGVKQAVERMNAEAPEFFQGGGGGIGGSRSNGGGGFFRVDDHVELIPSRARPEVVISEILKSFPGPCVERCNTKRQRGSSTAGFAEFLPLADASGYISPSFSTGPDGRGSVNAPSAETELCMYGGAFNVTVEGHFEELFTATLPHQWANLDGEGGTFEFLQNVLVVRHTWQAHADIEALLRLIEAAFLKPLTEPIEIRAAGYATEADVATRKKLTQIVDADFQDIPLSDVAGWIRERLDVQVLLDKVTLEEEGIGTDSAVTLHFKGISGELLLSRVLKPLQLDFQIEEGLLIVTTVSKVKDRLVTKVYDIRDLLDRGLHPSQPLRAIESATPGPWLNTDGEGGSMQLFADTLLIIQQTPTNHAEVAKFLAGLRFQLGDQPKVPRVIKPRPKTPLAAQPNQPATNEPKPTTPAPTKPTADNQARYEGKSFDEWLAILDTERSPKHLVDAIEALRLLGRDTHADQVAERVLKIARVVDAGQTIYGATYKLFSNLPDAVAQRAFANELRNGTARSRKFVLEYMIYWDKLESDDYVTAVLNICRDSDPEVRMFAVARLVSLPLDGKFAKHAAQRTTQLRQSLADTEPRTVLRAAFHLLDSETDSKTVAEALARIVAKPASPDQRMEALNLIAVMGPRATSVASKVADVLLEKSDGNDVVPTHDIQLGKNQPFFWLGQYRTELNQNWQLVAAVALARMGKAVAIELPKIDSALEGLSDGYKERRSGVSLGQSIQLAELLIAAKTRIEPPPALNLRDGELTTIELALSYLVWNHKLIQMEQALLQQYRGNDHSSDKELVENLNRLSGAFDVVDQHRAIRRRPKSGSVSPQEVAEYLASGLNSKRWRTDTPSNLPHGLTILATSPRETAIMELGKLGAAARDALPVLKKELESKDKSVAAAAEKAIKQIEDAKDDQKTN